MGTIAGADFDHVAAAAPRAEDLLETLGSLGATLLFGRTAPGFRWALNRVGEADRGISVEVLEPWQPERNDFLARFVSRHGVAFHHITFKVPELARAITAVREAGLEPVGINTSNPLWKEAFLHPRDAHGIVVQLAESPLQRPPLGRLLEWARAAPPAREQLDGVIGGPRGVWRPQATAWHGPAAIGVRVVLHTDDARGAAQLFGDLLGGTAQHGSPPLHLTWASGGAIAIHEDGGARGVAHVEYAGASAARGPAARLFRQVDV